MAGMFCKQQGLHVEHGLQEMQWAHSAWKQLRQAVVPLRMQQMRVVNDEMTQHAHMRDLAGPAVLNKGPTQDMICQLMSHKCCLDS